MEIIHVTRKGINVINNECQILNAKHVYKYFVMINISYFTMNISIIVAFM